jgi:V8-like Glu-specific endopeptidase
MNWKNAKRIIVSVSVLAAWVLLVVTSGSVLDTQPALGQASAEKVPRGLSGLPFLSEKTWAETRRGAKPGRFFAVERDRRAAISDEYIPMPAAGKDPDEDKEGDLSQEVVPKLQPGAGDVEFEFFDVKSERHFRYKVDRAELAKASRAISRFPNERNAAIRTISNEDLKREDETRKAWSNATDNRTRRAIADGYSDINSIYQRLADYGGCSATVLYASNSQMVAITAAHCIYIAGGSYSSSKIRPRRNGGTSPTWGSWTAVGFGFYPQFLDNDCEDNWDGSDCIKHDIALVVAVPDAGANPPNNMGWGYRPKSFLDDHSKYRRGYPSCNNGHSPNPCTTNNLYGDGALSVGNFSQKDSDNWNRRLRFSSDTNPGDSGSGLYYYRNNFPYVFAVTSAEKTCYATCTSSRPNYARRITPQFFDFINSVVP